MNSPLHYLRLTPPERPAEGEMLRVVRPVDVQWGAPIFLAPALPTPLQLGNEVPFTANFSSVGQVQQKAVRGSVAWRR
jgi:hypothetical protein